MRKELITLLIALFLVAPGVSAMYINNTVLESTGLNTLINITYPWNVSEIIVDSNYIFAGNLTSSNPSEVSNEAVSWNLTESNANYEGTDVPYYSASSNISKTITSGFSTAVGGGLASFDVDYCDISNIYYSSALSTYDRVFTAAQFSCNNKQVDINLSGLDPGDNIIALDYNVSFFNCTGGNVSIQFSIYDEDDPAQWLNATAEVDMEYWVHPDYVRNFSHKFEGNHTYMICLSPSEATIYADVYIKYSTDNGFTHRYFVHNGTFTNSTTNLTIYNTNTTTGYSNLKITTRHRDTYQYFKNVVTSLERFYPAENTWRVVQMDKSGDYGLNVFNIHERITDYRLVFRDTSNNILDTTETTKFECDPTTGVCDLTFLLDEYTAPEAPTGFTLVWWYDEANDLINASWTDVLGSTNLVRVYVRKDTMAGSVDICDNSYTGTSGSSICNVSIYTGDLFVQIDANGDTRVSEWVNVGSQQIGSLLSQGEGTIWAVLIIVIVCAFGLFSPAGAIIAMVIGLVFVFLLGLVPAITTPFIIIAAIIGIIIGHKVRT